MFLAEHEERSRSFRCLRENENQTVWLTLVALNVGGAARAEARLNAMQPWAALGRHAEVHGRALVAEDLGDSARAADLYGKAAAGWEAWGSVPLRAYALLGLGRCASDARALAEGNETFDRLGATPLAVAAA